MSNQGAESVYFDNLAVNVIPGVLLEEKHYYPYGLPIQGWGNVATGSLPNRQRYQGNEYREEAGLNWMDFHNRQYDPQLGRFLGVDALADKGGQQVLSPYHAMACNPALMVDPLGLRSDVFDNGARSANPPVDPLAYIKAMFPTANMYLPGGSLFNAGNYARNSMIQETLTRTEVLRVLNRIDEALGSLGYESRSISAALGRSASSAGEIVKGQDAVEYEGAIIDHSTLGTDRQSYQFGDLKISFSKRGGGLGAELLDDELDRRGIWVFAVFEGDLSAYEKTDWIQSVYSTIGINNNPGNEWFNDYSKDSKNNGKNINRPFYYDKSKSTKAWRRDMDVTFNGRIFHDGPNRAGYASSNFSWNAQLSLVGLRNGSWETIQTVRYGFSVKGSTVTYSPMILNNISNGAPNYFHQSLINLLNSYRK